MSDSDFKNSEDGESASALTVTASESIDPGPKGGELRAFGVVYDDDRSSVADFPFGRELILGRSRSASITVSDPQVSREHVAIRWTGGKLLVRDLGSHNGTRLNGLTIDGETIAGTGDEVQFGNVRVVLTVTSCVLESQRRLLTHADFARRLADEVARSRSHDRPSVLIMIKLDASQEAITAGLEAIASALREVDVIGTYGRGEFEVLMPEAEGAFARKQAHKWIERSLEKAGAAGHAGLASVAQGDAEEVFEQARRALRIALEGAERVVIGGRDPNPRYGELVVVDPAMQEVFELVDKVARNDLTVLILGETGAGKEVVAEAIHRRSRRNVGPFICVNVAALSPTLIESELFGHERGAFTGAMTEKEGYFEAARGGTLLLDEIGELPIQLQAKLLRILEHKTVTRIGGTNQVDIDVRILAATNREVTSLVSQGRFREDLYFRLNAVTIEVPPLRERPADIVPLAERFAEDISMDLKRATPVLSPEARFELQKAPWPGNVRQLRNVIERAIVLCEGDIVGAACVPSAPTAAADEKSGDSSGTKLKSQVDSFERQRILEALEHSGWNKARAASELGISRRTLFYKLQKLGLRQSDD